MYLLVSLHSNHLEGEIYYDILDDSRNISLQLPAVYKKIIQTADGIQFELGEGEIFFYSLSEITEANADWGFQTPKESEYIIFATEGSDIGFAFKRSPENTVIGTLVTFMSENNERNRFERAKANYTKLF